MLKFLGMVGKINIDQFLMDQIVDIVNDFINEMIKLVFEKDEVRKVDSIVYIIDLICKWKRFFNYIFIDKQYDMYVILLCMLCFNFFIYFDEEKKNKNVF